ncbi:MAG: hypothetical protein IJ064_07875 [Bacteroidaceae bacterium]|nr:hypothetical protein [Bacteroidaceae bacterium]
MKNNNPLRLRHTGDITQGLTPQQTDPHYLQFRSLVYGYRAAFVTIRNLVWISRRDTLERILTYWAPDAAGADSQLYTARVCALTGFSPDDEVNPIDVCHMVPLVAAISRIENGRPPHVPDIMAGWRLYRG